MSSSSLVPIGHAYLNDSPSLNPVDQSTDNDDDVIVMPMDAPSITEILDDDEEEEAAAATGGRSPKSTVDPGESNDASQDVLVDTANIKMPMPGVVHIKTEPTDDGYKDDEEDAFMDVGTIEPIDETLEEEESQEGREAVEDSVEGGESRDHQVVNHEEETVLTVDTTSEGGTRQSPETIALDSPSLEATGGASSSDQLNGTVEMLDTTETLAPVVTIVPNKIKINISKLASASLLQVEGNTDSRDSVNSVGGQQQSQGGYNESVNNSRAATPEPEPEIEYEVKEGLRGANLMRMPTVANGIETSGLCSIM